MCGYCCGNTPVEKRGEGHKGCSEACYNAPGTARLATVTAERDEARAQVAAVHICTTRPLCDGWPFSVDDAYRTIAAVAWPAERKENRDGWAVTMRNRPDLFEHEAARARERLEAAIAHGRAALDSGDAGLGGGA